MGNSQRKKYNALVHNMAYLDQSDSGQEKDIFVKCPSCNKDTKWNNGAYWFGKNLQCSHCEQFNYISSFR